MDKVEKTVSTLEKRVGKLVNMFQKKEFKNAEKIAQAFESKSNYDKLLRMVAVRRTKGHCTPTIQGETWQGAQLAREFGVRDCVVGRQLAEVLVRIDAGVLDLDKIKIEDASS